MAAVQFSENALALLRLHFSGHSLMMGASNPESLPGRTVEETQAAYAELVAAGYMIAIDTPGQERGARYWLTLAAIERKAEWLGAPPPKSRATPGPPAAPAP
jgi:hypothetical protein